MINIRTNQGIIGFIKNLLAAAASEGKFCTISCLNRGRKVVKSQEIKEQISQAMSQENHWNWQGGKSGIYCNEWRYIRTPLKELDNNECQNPYCEGKSQRLTSHHIDYNKQNCLPNNITTLCVVCNSQANFNRNYWQKIYTTLKNERG